MPLDACCVQKVWGLNTCMMRLWGRMIPLSQNPSRLRRGCMPSSFTSTHSASRLDSPTTTGRRLHPLLTGIFSPARLLTHFLGRPNEKVWTNRDPSLVYYTHRHCPSLLSSCSLNSFVPSLGSPLFFDHSVPPFLLISPSLRPSGHRRWHVASEGRNVDVPFVASKKYLSP